MSTPQFSWRLAQAVREKGSCLMLGLDPNLERLPEGVERDAAGVEVFCKRLIDATEDLVCGVKLQMAYFEVMGAEGLRVVENLLRYAKEKGLITLVDGKRNDIGSTAAAYAKAYLEPGMPLEADACTVNPLLGTDGVAPFVEKCAEHGKGIFVLVRTSNPSSTEVQGYADVCVRLAELVEEWNISTQDEETQLSSVGAVVGATHGPMMKFFREELPHSWILAPGVGAQGGQMEDVLGIRTKDDLGVIVPVSRSVIFASGGADYAEAARGAMKELYDQQKAYVPVSEGGKKECGSGCSS